MFSLSPIPPTGGHLRLAGAVPAPVEPAVELHPLYAAQLEVRDAGQSMLSVASILRPMTPAIWPPIRPVVDVRAASEAARRGIAAIDAALGFQELMRPETASLLGTARKDAIDGLALLTAKTFAPVDYFELAPKFEAVADQLVQVDTKLAEQLRAATLAS
jgi:hypothetical protein